MKKGDKVKRIHPGYPGSWIEKEKAYFSCGCFRVDPIRK